VTQSGRRGDRRQSQGADPPKRGLIQTRRSQIDLRTSWIGDSEMETPAARKWWGWSGCCRRLRGDLLRLTRGELTLATKRLKLEPAMRATAITTRRRKPLMGLDIEAQRRKTKLLLNTRSNGGLPSRRAPVAVWLSL
jgi:hypothetical protein